ncbi:MAG: DUF3108 domain-containing protein, partial [Muribaculaceae bacterium]
MKLSVKDIVRGMLHSLKAATLVAVAAAIMVPQVARAAEFANEDLNYEIVYHWGLIWKHAASATLSLRNDGDVYRTSLTARTVSWADGVYRVRDTLTCTIAKEGLRPLHYVKASHEGKHDEVDEVKYSYRGYTTTGLCTRKRPGKETVSKQLETQGTAYDMLSVFYFLRKLNFAGMRESTVYKSTVFSGKRKETVSVKLVGIEEVKLRDKSKHRAYHVQFTFTQDGATKSSDDIDTWISTDEQR